MAIYPYKIPPLAWDSALTNGAERDVYQSSGGTDLKPLAPRWLFAKDAIKAIQHTGQLPITPTAAMLRLIWSTPVTSGAVVWGAALAAISAGDVSTYRDKTYGTASEAQPTVQATAHRHTLTAISIADLDGLTQYDYFNVTLYRDGADASDTADDWAYFLGGVLYLTM